MNTIDINQLPADIKQKVMDTLTCYNSAYVEYENGTYTYCAGVYLDTSIKADDYAFYEIKQEDVYTEAERAENLRVLNTYATPY